MTKPATTVPDFMIWRCACCEAPAVGKQKPCDCATNVGARMGPNGKMETTWWDAPLSDCVSVPRELIERILRARGGFNELMELEALLDGGKQP